MMRIWFDLASSEEDDCIRWKEKKSEENPENVELRLLIICCYK